MTSGQLSAEEFGRQVKRFVDMSNKIGDDWRLVSTRVDTLYMVKRCSISDDHRQNCPRPLQRQKESEGGEASLSQSHIPSSSTCTSSLLEQQKEVTSPTSTPSSQLATHLTSAQTTAGTGSKANEIDCNQYDVRKSVSPISSVDEMEPGIENEDDAWTLTVSQKGRILTYEYHVVYSESYSVPALYINIYTTDGKLLPLDEVWKLCPASFKSYIKENKWSTLTQQEHPLLGRPFLLLHPCHTADLMTQITRGDSLTHKHYLATWLSTVGPLVALTISPQYILMQ